MTVLFGCIADDFTGATDIAGILARAGVKVNLRMGIPEHSNNLAPFEIIALKCRTEPVPAAVSQSLAALNWLRKNGATRFYWKYCSTFDSTTEGNIGPVAEALMAELGTEQTIYCPAFPENGRSIYMGMLFVGEQPLGESPMKDHPLTPMRDSNLTRLLQPQVKASVGSITLPTVRLGKTAVSEALRSQASDGIAHVVIDAVENKDLSTIVDATSDFPLLTGGSALALHLPDLYQQSGLLESSRTNTTSPLIGGGQIVLSGSCSAMTQEQVKHYRQQAETLDIDPLALHKDPDLIKSYIDWIRSWPAQTPKIVSATTSPAEVQHVQDILGRHNAGLLIEQCLAELAAAAVDHGVRKIVVAGGETSGAVTHRLGVTDLQVGQEITPGVPWTFSHSQSHPIALALKSGNFGNADFFSKAFTALDDQNIDNYTIG